MIETLNGIHETVNFSNNSTIMLYNNDECEDYPIHWHTPIEIVMPLEHTYKAVCNDVSFDLSIGDILLIAPGTLHTLSAPPSGRRLIFQADISLLNSIKECESAISLISPATLITPSNAPQIHDTLYDIMMEILDEYDGDAILSDASIYSKLIRMFVLIGRTHATDNDKFETSHNKQQEYIEKFMEVCDYINKHCTENLTLDDVAEMAGFSKYHFSRLFKQFTSHSFYKYLNLRRIMFAEKMLINPETSVTEVALLSGFNSISAFIRMFKICKKCTPTEFRNMFEKRKN